MARFTRYSSRLARKESRRMIRQSLLLVLLTGAILAGVIFWGIPTLVRLAGFLGDVKSSSQPIENEDNIAPFTPQLTALYEATASATVELKGYAEPNATLYLFNNGNKVEEKLVDSDGSFVFLDVMLQPGGNEFTAQAVDDAGNESTLSRVVGVVYDTEAPGLVIDSPQNHQEFYGFQEKSVIVTGTTDPHVKVLVNDRVAFVNSQGEFRASVSLNSGENIISVMAIDQAGNETVEEIIVKFTE